MNKIVLLLVLGLVLLSMPLFAADNNGRSNEDVYLDKVISSQLDDGESVVAKKVKVINGDKVIFLKVTDAKGEVQERFFDGKGKKLSKEKLPKAEKSYLGKKLNEIVRKKNSGVYFADLPKSVKVNIALIDDDVAADEVPVTGSADVYDGESTVVINGKKASKEEILAVQKKKWLNILDHAKAKKEKKNKRLEKFAKRNVLEKNASVLAAEESETGTFTLTLSVDELESFVNKNKDLIAGVELYEEPKDEITSAMLSSRVDPYALNYSSRKGEGIGIYMTESGAANSGHITNYYKISGSRTDHSENVSAILRAVSPESFVYGKGGAVLPTSTDINGYNNNPGIHIVTRSNGSGDSGSYTTTDRDWDNFVYDKAIPAFKSAGNNGNANGYMSSPGNGLNIISVGNYSDSNDTISSSSSYKDPETGNAKPEISAPGTSITAGGHTMSGTSMSAPHAAAVAADLMEAYSWMVLKPYYIKALLLSGAKKTISGGSDKVGVGGVDFYTTYYSHTNTWWEGGNSSFDYFDSNDTVPDSGYIERPVTLSSSYSNVRIVLSWLNRGTYSYDHRADSHSIGMDFDIRVYDPNGNFVGGSYSWDNSYEVVNFDPTVSGEYVVKISRYANRDTSSKLHMGLSINW